MLVGYARVSTQEQDLALQLDALKTAGCSRVFEEKASGAQRERPALKAALEYMREGDTLVVWRLDRLARSLKQLIETVESFGTCDVGLRSLTEAIDPPQPAASWSSTSSRPWPSSSAASSVSAPWPACRRPGHVAAGGRPPALKAKDLAAAKALLRDPEITVVQVAKRLGVAASTLYRHLPRARTAADGGRGRGRHAPGAWRPGPR